MQIVLFLSCSLLPAGCRSYNPENEHPEKTIKVRLDDVKPAFVLQHPEMVQLEMANGRRVGMIAKLYATPQHFVIFDRLADAILVYDKSGKFLRRIGETGNARGQYATVTDMVYYEDSRTLEIFSIPERKFLQFSLSGELLSERKVPFDFLAFYKTKAGYWLYGCFPGNKKKSIRQIHGNQHNLLLVSEDFSEVLQSYCPASNFFDRTGTNSNFSRNDRNELFFHYGYTDAVYKLQDDEAAPFIKLDFGPAGIPEEKLRNATNNKDFDEILYNSGRRDGYKIGLKIGNGLLTFGGGTYANGVINARPVFCNLESSTSYVRKAVTFADSSLDLGAPVLLSHGKAIFAMQPLLMKKEQLEKLNAENGTHLTDDGNFILIIVNEQDIL